MEIRCVVEYQTYFNKKSKRENGTFRVVGMYDENGDIIIHKVKEDYSLNRVIIRAVQHKLSEIISKANTKFIPVYPNSNDSYYANNDRTMIFEIIVEVDKLRFNKNDSSQEKTTIIKDMRDKGYVYELTSSDEWLTAYVKNVIQK